MTASISFVDLGIFAVCVSLGLGWIWTVHRFLKNSGAGDGADDPTEPTAGSGH